MMEVNTIFTLNENNEYIPKSLSPKKDFLFLDTISKTDRNTVDITNYLEASKEAFFLRSLSVVENKLDKDQIDALRIPLTQFKIDIISSISEQIVKNSDTLRFNDSFITNRSYIWSDYITKPTGDRLVAFSVTTTSNRDPNGEFTNYCPDRLTMVNKYIRLLAPGEVVRLRYYDCDKGEVVEVCTNYFWKSFLKMIDCKNDNHSNSLLLAIINRASGMYRKNLAAIKKKRENEKDPNEISIDITKIKRYA